MHEGLDPGTRLPFGRYGLVAADVHIGIGEKASHLAEEALDELVSLLAGRIKGEVGDAELAADRIGGAIAGKLRVSNEQAAQWPGISKSGTTRMPRARA